MFTVRADFSESFEILSKPNSVRLFFSDVKNFIDLMPNIESVHTDANGIMHWKIRVVIPLVGSFSEKFSLSEVSNDDETIEWKPTAGEKHNLMSFSTNFLPKGKNKTLVQFSQIIELRRTSAAELHFLAGFAGESVISGEMTRRISEMLDGFIQNAKDILEKED
ncbi:MAG: hypothetical protein HKN25_17960 [Pyrinomonadaceae bacterium]|nr:hypothetical protein [Pyrinomonadaceae bacterium]